VRRGGTTRRNSRGAGGEAPGVYRFVRRPATNSSGRSALSGLRICWGSLVRGTGAGLGLAAPQVLAQRGRQAGLGLGGATLGRGGAGGWSRGG
jgi:hypothetical protein